MSPFKPKFKPKSLFLKAVLLIIPVVAATFLTLRIKSEQSVALDSVPFKDTKVLIRALQFLENYYVNPKTLNADEMIRSSIQQLELSIAPFLAHEKNKRLEISLGDKKIVLPLDKGALGPNQLHEISEPLGRILGFLEMYYKGKLKSEDRLSLVMEGIFSTLDPHSNYLSTKSFNEFKIQTHGNFGGLGIVIGLRKNELTVLDIIPNTPAAKIGLKPKDRIVQIGDEATVNMSINDAVERLRGPIGSKVSVVVARTESSPPTPENPTPPPTEEKLNFTLVRALIQIQSVTGKVVEYNSKKFALLKLKSFQEDSLDQLKKRLKDFRSEGNKLEGLILDLRNDPGGLLDQAVRISDEFLKQGVIVKTVSATGESEVEKAGPGQEEENLPLIVLVNEGSASASEIVTGALQLNDRVLVIGNRTFGKGSVQTIHELKDGSAIKVTIANYYTAQDQKVQSIGINPDIGLVPATINTKGFNIFEDVKPREIDLVQKNRDEDIKSPDLPPAPFQMTYLAATQKEDPEDEESLSLSSELKEDFPVQLAKRILETPEGQSLNRQTMLKVVPGILEQVRQEEDDKVAKAMNDLSIDWSKGPDNGSPAASVSLQMTDEKGVPRTGFSAGESGYIKVTVENKGPGTYYQLAAVTKTDDPLFANIEFPFGKIGPQEKKEWKAFFKAPDFINQRQIPVTLEFHELYKHLPVSTSYPLVIEEKNLPRFQYEYSVLDGGGQNSSGNSNHMIDRGETIVLGIKVKNIGDGPSQAPIVSLKNLEGDEVFVEKGRLEMEPLEPGKESEGFLRFKIPSKGTTNHLNFDLNIYDNHFGEDLSDRLTLPIHQENFDPPVTLPQIPPKITLAQTPDLITSSGNYVIKGAVEDDQEIKHLFIFVGDKKVYYQKPESDSKSLSFETKISLKKGANFISVAAQDDRELTTRKQWIVWRNK